MDLNDRAARCVEEFLKEAPRHRIAATECPSGARVVDCSAGGLAAGRHLARVCTAGLAEVRFVPGPDWLPPLPAVEVWTDQPVAACLASQYAGWKLASGKFFAMGSGPMRAAAGKEELFAAIGHREAATCAVGVLETGQPPPPGVCRQVAEAAGISPRNLTLLFAPTASQPGNVQVVARSVETALHKLHELQFDVGRIASGFGVAPLPPVARHDLAGIGRTNDAILYGGAVTLWVRGDDASLAAIVPRVPSCSSRDHGAPFEAIFRRYDGDFYRIDPLLFSPAVICLVNLDTGNSFRFGRIEPELLRRSFGYAE